MASTYVRLDGAEQLEKVLRQLVEVVVEVAVEALTAWAHDVRGQAQRNVPIDTGNLGSAIEARIDRTRLRAEVGVWEPDAYYSLMVELGTSSQQAQPYLGPAFELHRDLTPYARAAWTAQARRVGR